MTHRFKHVHSRLFLKCFCLFLKELEELKSDSKKDKAEIAKLGVAAKEGLEAIEKVDELKKSNKELSAENKTLAENFNSERVTFYFYYLIYLLFVCLFFNANMKFCLWCNYNLKISSVPIPSFEL